MTRSLKDAVQTYAQLIGCTLLLLGSNGFGQTNRVMPPTPQHHVIKTKFASGTELTPAEAGEVLLLAKQCGFREIDELKTFHWLPSGGQGISVKSKERADGRTITFETLTVHKDGGAFKPPKDIKRVGKFWTEAKVVFPTVQRLYQINKKAVRVTLGDGVSVNLADKVIPAIMNKNVRFAHDWIKQDLDKLIKSHPTSISIHEKGYKLWFESQDIVSFVEENGAVTITALGRYEI